MTTGGLAARLFGSRRRRRLVALLVTAALVLAAGSVLAWRGLAGDDGQYRRGSVFLLTGGTTGIYYSYGQALADAVNAELDGVTVTNLSTSASVENLQRVANAPNSFGFAAADAAAAAVRGGAEPFPSPLPVRAVARIYDEYIHLVVRESSPIQSLADLRGRAVSLGANGSGTALVAERLLQVAPDLDLADVTASYLGLEASAAALRDGSIDAFFWQGGLPTKGISDLAAAEQIRFVPLGDLVDELNDAQEWGAQYRQGVIPRGAYVGIDETPTVAMPDLLVTHVDTDPGLVHEVTRILFEARADIAREVPVANALDRRSAISTGPVPLHDGALRYYRETKI